MTGVPASGRRRLLPAFLGTVVGIVLVLGLAGCGSPGEDPAAAAPAPAGPWFEERAGELGLDFVHFNGMSGDYSIIEEMAPGAALADFDGDGDLDVYVVQGRMLGSSKTLDDALFPPRHPLPLTDRLYRNRLAETGRLGFEDATAGAGLEPTSGYGMGVAAGDVDGDGDVDLYVTAFGANRLLENRGDGTFREVPGAGGAQDERWSIPATFFDADGDGDLDLFVGNYVDAPEDGQPVCRDSTGKRDYCGPTTFSPYPDRLFVNRGGPLGADTFEDATGRLGFAGAPAGAALGATAADLDGDGRLDLYVAHDQYGNHLWLRQADGTYRESALLAGAAVNGRGTAEGSMGVDAGDPDGDGDLDIFLTHMVVETHTLYRNRGDGLFDDATTPAGLAGPSVPYAGFGTAWFDADGDGLLDLFVANGTVNTVPELARAGDPFPLHQPNQLFVNVGDGAGGGASGGLAFREVPAAEAGEALALSAVSRGAAFGDLDEDGDADVLVLNNNGPAHLLLNRSENNPERLPWLGVRLLLADPLRDAHGATAELVTAGGGRRQVRRVRVDGSYLSASDPRLLFALPPGTAAGTVRVQWPGGEVEEFGGLVAGRYHDLHHGRGAAPDRIEP